MIDRSRFGRVLGVAACCLLVVTACGGDDEEDSTTATSDGAGSTATTALALEGEPINIWTFGDYTGGFGDQSYIGDAVVAAAEALNAAGGIDGRPIEVTTCDGKFNANDNAACARSAVEDGAVAVVGSLTNFGDAYLPILSEAGIPSIGLLPISISDFNDPLSYPLTGGSFALTAGMGALAADEGASSVHTAYVDVEGGALAAQLVEVGLGANGLTGAGSTPVSLTEPDLSASVASAVGGDTDAIVMALTEGNIGRFIQGVRQSGADIPLVASRSGLTGAALESLGSEAEGVFAVGLYALGAGESPEFERMASELDEFGGDDIPLDDLSANAWTAVQLFAVAAGAATEINPAGLVAALDATTDLDLGVLPSAVSFADVPELMPGVSRVVNPNVVFTVVEDGAFRVTRDDVNPFLPLEG